MVKTSAAGGTYAPPRPGEENAMPKLTLRAIRTEELHFRLTGARPQAGDKIDLKPTFSRKVRRAQQEEGAFALTLSVRLGGEEGSRSPFDAGAALTGFFHGGESEREAVIRATEVLYLHLRAVLAAAMSAAMVAPVQLPLPTRPLFAEDAPEGGGLVS